MSYNSIKPARVEELRKIADNLRGSAELNALCLMWAMRSMQEAEEDMLDSGDITPNDLYDKVNCYERAADYLEDTVNKPEMAAVANENELGDYSLRIVPVVKVERQI